MITSLKAEKLQTFCVNLKALLLDFKKQPDYELYLSDHKLEEFKSEMDTEVNNFKKLIKIVEGKKYLI